MCFVFYSKISEEQNGFFFPNAPLPNAIWQGSLFSTQLFLYIICIYQDLILDSAVLSPVHSDISTFFHYYGSVIHFIIRYSITALNYF